MSKDLVKLIKKVQNKFGEDSFEVSNLERSFLENVATINEVYNEGDLTKNFVKFSTDLLSEKYGSEYMEEIIEGFGEVLKTDINDFKESYRNKQSAIKEILPSVYIHTSMSKILMESLVVDLIKKAKLHIKFHNKGAETTKWTKEKIRETSIKYTTMSEFLKCEPEAYRASVRLGYKHELAKYMKKTPISEEVKSKLRERHSTKNTIKDKK